MDLLLLRHGQAAPFAAGPGGMPGEGGDAARPLTPEGRAELARTAEHLRRAGFELDRVFASPLLRARQSAEVLTGALGGVVEPIGLLAEEPAEDLLAELRGISVAAIGHAPWIGELAAWLVTGSRRLGGQFPFAPGAAAWLEGSPEPGCMVLRAFLPPAILDGREGGR